VLFIVVAIAGCARAGDDTTPIPTIPSPSVSLQPLTSERPTSVGDELTGTIGADSIEGGCTYLETLDGTRYEVIYPDGWTIDRSSATLRDPSGEVIASGGDVVTVRGREATDMASFCMIGPIFQATEVVSASDR
jgi:hypothetical protein